MDLALLGRIDLLVREQRFLRAELKILNMILFAAFRIFFGADHKDEIHTLLFEVSDVRNKEQRK